MWKCLECEEELEDTFAACWQCGTPDGRLGEAPIQNLDSVDITGQRQGGGVDLAIVSSSYLDDSVATRQLLMTKLETYLAALHNPDFQKEFGVPNPKQTGIIVLCVCEPAKEIVDLIEQLKPEVMEHGASLSWKLTNV